MGLPRGAGPRLTPYIPHTPTPTQAAFLMTEAKEAFYGGAAGGGKSEALLMAALQYVDHSSYAALLVRQSFVMLSQSGALLDRAMRWLALTDATWSSEEHTWRFPSGATLCFRHLQDETALQSFQSAEYQFIGVDEVTDLEEQHYRFLFSRLRRVTGSAVPLRMRSASNPFGPGREWCHRRFIVEAAAHGRVFIPARLEDNPHLEQESYEESLAELAPGLYQQLRYGDWTVRPEGELFRRASFDDRFIDERDLPEKLSLCRYWDLAATEPRAGSDPDHTAGVLLGRTPDGLSYVIDVARIRSSPLGVEKLVRKVADTDRAFALRRHLDPAAVRMEQEPGSSGKSVIDQYQRLALAELDFAGVRSTGSKEARARPVAARAEAGQVFVRRGAWNTAFLDELCSFPSGAHDDQVDALSGAFAHLAGAPPSTPVAFPVMDSEPSYWRMGMDDEGDLSWR